MMALRPWQLGDRVPLDYRLRPFGAALDRPVWYILLTAPRAESAARAWLTRLGVRTAWYPSETRVRNVRGRAVKAEYERVIAPGYLFAEVAYQPNWFVLFDRSLGRLRGVIGTADGPRAVPEAAILSMMDLPARIERERRLAEAEAAARRPAPGDEAMVRRGLLAGHRGRVLGIHAGIARIVGPLFGGLPVAISVEDLKRVEGTE